MTNTATLEAPTLVSGDVSLDRPLSCVLGDDDVVGSAYARCADGNGTLSHLFFSDDEVELARAKAICARCGLRERCLDGAVERREPYGV